MKWKLFDVVALGTSLTGTSGSVSALDSAGMGSSCSSSIGSSGVGARGGLRTSCVISVIRESVVNTINDLLGSGG
jgi:hypothetical protein